MNKFRSAIMRHRNKSVAGNKKTLFGVSGDNKNTAVGGICVDAITATTDSGFRGKRTTHELGVYNTTLIMYVQ